MVTFMGGAGVADGPGAADGAGVVDGPGAVDGRAAAPQPRIRRADVALVIIVAAVSTASLAWGRPTGALDTGEVAGYAATAVLVAAPLAFGRIRPVHVIAALTAVLDCHTVLSALLLRPDPVPVLLWSAIGRTAFIAIAPAAYLVARHRPTWTTVGAVAAPAVTLPLTLVISAPSAAAAVAQLALWPFLVGVVVVILSPAWATGYLRRRRLAQAEQQRARAARALAAERTRIARELHDLVLADLARIAERAERPEPDVREALLEIAAAGRDTLTAMRRLLGMLRGTGDEPSVAEPQPTLGRLDELVADVRAGGLDVRLTRVGQPRSLPDEVELAAYRLVQETLAGADRGTAVDLAVGYEDGAVRIVADGDLSHADGIASRERVRLLGGWMRLRRSGRPSLEVVLPEQRPGPP